MSTIGGSGGSVPTPNERVGRALDDLAQVARPVVVDELRRAYGDDWFRQAQQGPLARSPRAREDQLDAYLLLALLSWAWDDVFAAILPPHARQLVSQAAEARNDWGHQQPFSPAAADNAVRAVADLIAVLHQQPHVPWATVGPSAPPPPPFRLPGRRDTGRSSTSAPAPQRALARSRDRPLRRGCGVALVLLLALGALCGLGSTGIALLESRRPIATRTSVTGVPSRGTPTPTIVKPTIRATAAFDRYVVANTGGVGVYLRIGPGSTGRLRAYPDGTSLQSVGTPTTSTGGSRWHHVRAPDGMEGWVAGEYLLPSP